MHCLQKDKSCPQKGDAKDYGQGGLKTETLTLKSVTATAIYTPIVLVKCEGQGDNNFCHVVNAPKAKRIEKYPVFYRAKVMNGRSRELYVAVFVCALFGPLMLAGFFAYERGVVAKQA